MPGLKVEIKNVRTFERRMLTRAQRLVKTANKEVRDLVMFGTAFAKVIAPKKSGALALAIHTRMNPKGGEVISGMPRSGRSRPYHLWWHDRGGVNLSKIAAEKGWRLTGKAGSMGFPANMYMKAVAKAMGIKARNSIRVIGQSLRIGV